MTPKRPTPGIETGKSQSHSDLDRVARQWIQRSAGDIKVVLILLKYLELRLRFEDMVALELQERQSSKSLPLRNRGRIAI